MTGLQLYLLITPLVLMVVLGVVYWVSGIYDDPRRQRHHPGE